MTSLMMVICGQFALSFQNANDSLKMIFTSKYFLLSNDYHSIHWKAFEPTLHLRNKYAHAPNIKPLSTSWLSMHSTFWCSPGRNSTKAHTSRGAPLIIWTLRSGSLL